MSVRWLTADVFDGLATLEDGSVDLVVTSPPFLALRSYLPADHPDKGKEIGSEATPAEFLDVLLRVTAELGRVLAPHGSIAIELGDTYAGSGGAGGDYDENGLREGQPRFAGSGARDRPQDDIDERGRKYQKVTYEGFASGIRNMNNKTQGGGQGWPLAKSKTLIPELYRIALAYGFNPLTGQESPAGRWRVRNVVTWCRPNPPVGALGDKWRPATSDVVVACRSGKRFWDDLATRGPYKPSMQRLIERGDGRYKYKDDQQAGIGSDWTNKEGFVGKDMGGAPLLDYWEIPLLDGEEPKPYGPTDKPYQREPASRVTPPGQRPNMSLDTTNPAGAPLLDYWEIPPTGYAGAHYAVYPPALVEPLVKAMCPERVCRTCGEPSRRIVERERVAVANDSTRIKSSGNVNGWEPPPEEGWEYDRQTAGFTDCGHDDWRPGIVLDPFAGSGTTLAVASGHGHDTIGIDLDPRNEDLARERVGPLMWEVDGV